jgi:FixJ family two-component response regulator
MDNELSSREKGVLGWLLKGFSNKEISQALGISPRIVQKHTYSVCIGILAYRREPRPSSWPTTTRPEPVELVSNRSEGEGFTVRHLAHCRS